MVRSGLQVRSAVAAGIATVGILSTAPTAALTAEGACLTVTDYTDTALLDLVTSKLKAATVMKGVLDN